MYGYSFRKDLINVTKITTLSYVLSIAHNLSEPPPHRKPTKPPAVHIYSGVNLAPKTDFTKCLKNILK